jgi:putative tryptophan/tyrosine transport system substrate-binding protein
MDRRRFLLTWLIGALAAPSVGEAQPAVRPVIGILHAGSTSSLRPNVEAFRKGLRDLGYVEGKNVAIEYRYADGHAARLRALVADLLAMRVNVIVTSGTTATQAAKDATTTTPIVIAAGADPVIMGFAQSLARPGGNITGISIHAGELLQKRLELLHQAVPRAKVVAFLLQGANPGNAVFVSAMTTAASSFGLSIHPIEVRGIDFKDAFAMMMKVKADALVVIEDPTFVAEAKRIADLALTHRLPTMLGNRLYVHAGGFMAYGFVFEDLWRRSASYVDRILKGGNPAEMPIERADKFALIINSRTAKALGITIPPSLLVRADEVID